MPQPSRENKIPRDDDLGPLPPSDGHAGEEPEAEPPHEELDIAEEEDLLDDTTGEADPVEEIVTEGAESGWLEEAVEALDLDVGGHDFEEESSALLEGIDEPGVGDEDFGLDDSQVHIDDAGEEGPRTDDEELREEDLPKLPRLDAEPEGEEGDELGGFWEGGAQESTLPPWDDRAWERVAHPPSIGTVRALEVLGSTTIGGGLGVGTADGELTLVPGAGWEHGPVRKLVAGGGLVVALADAALVSRDAGAHWERLEGWQALAEEGAAIADAAIGDDGLWLLTRGGVLLSSRDGGGTWEGPRSKRVVALTTGPGGRVAGLIRLEDGRLGRFVAADGAVVVLEGEGLQVGEVRAYAALAGASFVLAGDGRVFRTAGEGWSRVDGVPGVTAMTTGDAGSLLAAFYIAQEDRSWLARVDVDGAARIVAEIGGEEGDDEPRVLALAWDPGRGVAWVGGAFGMLAFKPRGMRSSGGALGGENQ